MIKSCQFKDLPVGTVYAHTADMRLTWKKLNNNKKNNCVPVTGFYAIRTREDSLCFYIEEIAVGERFEIDGESCVMGKDGKAWNCVQRKIIDVET